MLVLWLVFALLFPAPQESVLTPEQRTEIAEMRQRAEREAAEHRQAAMRINELAGKIHSEADARALVDAIAKMFAKELPPSWVTRSIRKRIARAEFKAVSDPAQLISEQHIADVWNEYVREIGAADEALVTAAEIHNLRDANYATGQLIWARHFHQTIWTIPNVYAVGPDGKVADGCRAVEILRVLHDLENFYNLRSARERVKKGVLASDLIRKELEHPVPPEKRVYRLDGGARVEAHVYADPIRPAEYRYIQERGAMEFERMLRRLFDELFPE